MPPKQHTDTQMMEVMADNIPFSKLTVQLDDPDECPVEVRNTLIPPPEAAAETSAADIPVAKPPEAEASVTDMAKSEDSTNTHWDIRTRTKNAERRREICPFISILSEEEESNTETDTDDSSYRYFN